MRDLPKMTLKFTRELRVFFKENHDKCTNCGNNFHEDELTHLGFTKEKSFIYSCDKCCQFVDETVVRYGYHKRSYIIPNDESYLWRYIDFSKFVSMLLKKSLYFTKTSLFKDPFEGAIGILDNKESYDKSMLFALMVANMTAPTKDRGPISPNKEITDRALSILDCTDPSKLTAEGEKLLNEAKELSQQLENNRLPRREYIFVNCWHESDYESDAMWMLYSKDITNAIAIRTTYRKLYLALNKDPDIDIGRVNYIDFNKNFSATNSTQWYKRQSFAHEKEVRAVLISPSHRDLFGVDLRVDLDLLIDKIYISPYADNWFVELVKDICNKYGINKEILYSDLSKKPLY